MLLRRCNVLVLVSLQYSSGTETSCAWQDNSLEYSLRLGIGVLKIESSLMRQVLHLQARWWILLKNRLRLLSRTALVLVQQ